MPVPCFLIGNFKDIVRGVVKCLAALCFGKPSVNPECGVNG
jgi:hypothetical protein